MAAWQTLSRSYRKQVRNLDLDVWRIGGGWRWSVLSRDTGCYIGGGNVPTEQEARTIAERVAR